MFCKNCGKQLDDSARFCPDCGSAVGQGDGSGDIQVPKRSFRHDISKIPPVFQNNKYKSRRRFYGCRLFLLKAWAKIHIFF